MAVDLSSLTDTSGKLAAAVEADPEDADATIGVVVIIAEVIRPDGKRRTRVRYSDNSPSYLRLGMLHTAEAMETTGAMFGWMRGMQQSLKGSAKDSPPDQPAP